MPQPSRFAASSLAVYGISLVCLVATSWVTAPAFVEIDRIQAIGEVQAWVQRVAEQGFEAFGGKAAARVFSKVAKHGGGLSLVAAWLSLAAKQGGWFDALTAMRIPYLAVTATIPVSLVWIGERGLGLGLSVLAAALLLAQSWFLHGAAIGTPDAVVSAFWLLVVACHVRAMPRRGESSPRASIAWAALGSLALGVGLAVHLGTAWVVVPVVIHGAMVHRRALFGALRRGRFPLPAMALAALVVTPIAMLACAPDLAGRSPSSLVRRMLGPLDKASSAVRYLGEVYKEPPYPVGYGAHWMAAELPVLVLLLGVVGAALWGIARVRRQRVDLSATGLLVALFVFGALLGNAIVPPVLASFPPRMFAAASLGTFAVAMAVEAGAARLPPRFRRAAVVAFGAALALASTLDLSTRGAGFSILVGGTAHVIETDAFETDGSEVGVALVTAAGMGAASVHVEGAPRDYVAVMNEVGRLEGMKSAKRARRADVRIVRGAAEGAEERVTHRGVVLWSLVR